MRRFGPEERMRWTEMYLAGKTGEEVSVLFGVPMATVYRELRRTGCLRPPQKTRTEEGVRRYQREYRRNWRARNPDASKETRKEIVAFKADLKNVPCVDCGQRHPYQAMEFDHLNGETKAFKVSAAIGSRARILEEVAKCEVVCVLCHRLRSDTRMNRAVAPSKTVLRKRLLRERVDALKCAPCELCNRQYRPCQMDFDHVDPSIKTDKISDLVRTRRSWRVIESEIQKCRLLCALCHRLYTAGVL